jgi:hypothetical protein
VGKQKRNKKRQGVKVGTPIKPHRVPAKYSTQHTSTQRASPSFNEQTKQLSPKSYRVHLAEANPLITIAALGICLFTYEKYAALRPEEVRRIFSLIAPVLVSIWLVKRLITWRTIKYAKTETSQNIRNINRLLVWRTVLSILFLGFGLYPLLYLSGFPELVEQLVVEVFPRVTSRVVAILKWVATWVAAGIAGWLGNIFLGALGNLLYDVFKKKIVGRRRRADRVKEKSRVKAAEGEEEA